MSLQAPGARAQGRLSTNVSTANIHGAAQGSDTISNAGNRAQNRNNSIKLPKLKERKRIFISGVNSVIGHALFEQMRNDHMALRTGKKSHKFSGTIIARDADTVPSPNE